LRRADRGRCLSSRRRAPHPPPTRPPGITTEYTHLLAVLPEAYLLVSGGGQILAANDRAAALLGRDRGALVGSAIFDLVEDPREAVNARLEEWSGARAPTSAALALRGDAQRVWFDAAVVRPMAPDRS